MTVIREKETAIREKETMKQEDKAEKGQKVKKGRWR